jgi:hypothetical protein
MNTNCRKSLAKQKEGAGEREVLWDCTGHKYISGQAIINIVNIKILISRPLHENVVGQMTGFSFLLSYRPVSRRTENKRTKDEQERNYVF